MKLKILLPVYDDQESLNEILKKIRVELDSYLFQIDSKVSFEVDFVVVDDGSREKVYVSPDFEASTRILRLSTNLGHQRAIAVALCYIYNEGPFDYCLVMDSDGEDKPSDIKNLVNFALEYNSRVVVAARKSRYDSLSFKLFYKTYKILFKLLTGKSINFGNFMLLQSDIVKLLVFEPSLWNNLPGTILKLKVDMHKVSMNRGKRYFGKSKMNFYSLLNHGFSAMSVFLDQIYARLLISLVSLLIFINLLSIKNFSFINFLTYNTLSVILISVVLLMYLSHLTSRSQRAQIPLEFYKNHF